MNIVVYTKNSCPACVTAKRLMDSKGIEYADIDVEAWPDFVRNNFMLAYPEARQMPQIFIEGQRVGGLAGLQAALQKMGM
jgi:glutaredoxin 3